MNDSIRDIMKKMSTGFRFFFAGSIVGAGAVAIWAKHMGVSSDNPRMAFGLILALPVVILLAHLPALIIQIGDGVKKLKDSNT